MILPSPTAPDGLVKHLSSWYPSSIPPGSAVLCRCNAPLIATAFMLLRNNHSCYIAGKDIAAQLITQLKKFRAETLAGLKAAIVSWRKREVEKFEASNRFAKAAAVEDRAECLLLFVNKAQHAPSEVPEIIEQLFSPKSGGTVLSTVHKAKGLEWPTVFILDADKYHPPKWAKDGWQLEQETNLHYVAVTRAKEQLFYVKTDFFQNE